MSENRLMNSLLTKNTKKINGLSSLNTTRTALCVSALIAVISTSAFANRPAMEEEHSEIAPVAEPQTQTNQDPVNRPEVAAPSAVEIMMQGQGQQPYQRQTGDVVQLPATEIQPGETLKIQLLDSPRRGMSMDKVQQEYGQPMATSESVGQPPITHWTYTDRVVYFEYSTVLHVVAR